MSVDKPFENYQIIYLPETALCCFDDVQMRAIIDYVAPLQVSLIQHDTNLVQVIQDVAAIPAAVDVKIEAGTGVSIIEDPADTHTIGRIPSHLIPMYAQWILNDVDSASTPVWQQMKMDVALVGFPSPVFGKVVGLTVNCFPTTTHNAGVMDLAIYNATTGGDLTQAGAPVVLNRDPMNPATTAAYGQDWDDDGLAVSFGDMLELWTLAATGSQNIRFRAWTTFYIQEQCAYVVTGAITPDATGVYVRNGQYGGKPAFERVDGAYWLWWDTSVPAWEISVVKGEASNVWERISANPVGAYTAEGTHTGIATVAAQAD